MAAPSTLLNPRPAIASPPSLGLYVHLPWCIRKCPYCDFSSYESRGEVPEDAYVDAVLRDVETVLPLIWGRKVHTVFFGGGTPSLFSPGAIDRLLTGLRTLLTVDPLAEVTLEANPGTFEAQKFAEFRSAGINRLSVGIQSFNAEHLKALGRVHDAGQAHRAAEIALGVFDNVNFDLMYALPGQTPEQARNDVAIAAAYAPPHLSVYHLTLEPNTAFYQSPPQLPDDDVSAHMQETLEGLLGEAGYDHYETSAFARSGMRCRHNLNYWRFGDYLGLGAGAHGKITQPHRILRQERVRQPAAYMERAQSGCAVEREHEVDAADLGFEFMMNALRLTEGFRLALFEERTGLPLTAVLPQLDEAERRGLIERDHVTVRPTLQGQRFLNELLQLFLPDQG